MGVIHIRKYRNQDLASVGSLVQKVYKSHVYLYDPNEAAREHMLSFFDPKKNKELRQKFAKSPYLFVALDGKNIVGMVNGKEEHLSQLYVNGNYQRKGIGSVLLKTFEKKAKKLGDTKITVNSAPKAVSFYQRHGYKKSTGIRKNKRGGFLCQPMKKML